MNRGNCLDEALPLQLKQEAKMGGGGQDRISELPDTLRLHVLSFLPRKFAVRTSVLSTRWRDLWRFRWPYETTLNFDEDFSRGRRKEEIATSVNQIIHLRGRKKVEIFHLFFNPGTLYRFDALKWIQYAMVNRVEELYLDFSRGRLRVWRPFQLPDCWFSGESLTLLSLKCCDLECVSGFSRLRFLETLCLKSVNITDEMLIEVVDNCLMLEKLELRRCFALTSITVSARDLRLKSLIVVDCFEANEIVISAPNLSCFHFCGELVRNFSFSDLPLLSDVVISSAGGETGLCQTNWIKIIPNIVNVKVLSLCNKAIQKIAIAKEMAPILLSNLQELQLLMELMTETNLSDIHGFFRKCQCPKLEKIFIELPTGCKDPTVKFFLQMPLEEPLQINFSRLKQIRINSYRGHDNEIELVRFFLKNTLELELMILVCPEEVHKNVSSLRSGTSKQLDFIQMASPQAKIIMCTASEDNHGVCAVHRDFYFNY